MNTKPATSPTSAAHADDLGVAAYFEARKLGLSTAQAMRARDLAYSAALRG